MAIAYVPWSIATSGTVSGTVEIRPNSKILGLSYGGTIDAATFSFKAYRPNSGIITEGHPGPGSELLSGATFDVLKDSAGTTITIGSTGVTSAGYFIFNALTTTGWTPIEGVNFVQVVASAAQNTAGASGYLICSVS